MVWDLPGMSDQFREESIDLGQFDIDVLILIDTQEETHIESH